MMRQQSKSGKVTAFHVKVQSLELVMIKLTTANGLAIYVSVAQLVAIRPTVNDADVRGNAKAWIDLTSGKPLAVRQTPDEIFTLIQNLPKGEQTS